LQKSFWDEEQPNWFFPLLALIVLVGFIGFAFRQGMKVTPDKDNPDNWQSGASGDGMHHGSDGSF
jgi:hypothetical protein